MSSNSDHSPLVLVVDDEALLRMYAVDVVEDAGFRAIEAENAAEALELITQRSEIAVLLTDVNMPGKLDGLDLARRVYELRPEIHIVIVSGRVRPDAADMPPEGMFVSKPYKAAVLTGMIRAAVASA